MVIDCSSSDREEFYQMLQSMEQPVSLLSLQQPLFSNDPTYAYISAHIVIISTTLVVITVLTTLLRTAILKADNYRLVSFRLRRSVIMLIP